METLQQIGLRHTTDKATTHFYMDTYEHYLGHLRDKEFNLLEVGVAGGSSMKMWKEGFPKANLHGIDINPDCAGYVPNVHIGSQTDHAFLDKLFSEIGVPDILIEDGSHVGQDMIDTFKYVFPKMKSGSLYMLEDTHCIFSEHYSGAFEPNGRTKAYNFFADLPYHINVAGRGMCGEQNFCIDHPSTEPAVPEFSRMISAMFIHCGLWIFKRK